MTTEILKILNTGGAHLPTVDDWMKITEIIRSSYPKGSEDELRLIPEIAIERQSRLEELVRGKMMERKGQACEKCGELNSTHGKLCRRNPTNTKKYWQHVLLKKEMFVCEVDKPSDKHYNSGALGEAQKKYAKEEYTQAQSKVWFEGFEGVRGAISHKSGMVVLTSKVLIVKDVILRNATVFDFIIECERAKAEVNWTENFINELLK